MLVQKTLRAMPLQPLELQASQGTITTSISKKKAAIRQKTAALMKVKETEESQEAPVAAAKTTARRTSRKRLSGKKRSNK